MEYELSYWEKEDIKKKALADARRAQREILMAEDEAAGIPRGTYSYHHYEKLRKERFAEPVIKDEAEEISIMRALVYVLKLIGAFFIGFIGYLIFTILRSK